ncbi:hypothetical protein PFISCL1PPCAC_11929, partial [Pristionchus fissidentatus]
SSRPIMRIPGRFSAATSLMLATRVATLGGVEAGILGMLPLRICVATYLTGSSGHGLTPLLKISYAMTPNAQTSDRTEYT